MSDPLIQLSGLTKSFASVAALKGVDLDLQGGEILGLVGENGAGKSTLIKLLSGVQTPDGGAIRLGGRPVTFASPRDALTAGIAAVQQELECFPHLSIAENLMLGERWPRRVWGGVDWSALHAEAGRRLTQFGVAIETHRMVEELTAAEKQEVGIAGAVARRARLLILDEPTASLSEPEVRRLFLHLRRLREQGVAILYVSHRLDEIFELTDRIAVLRDGALVAVSRTSEIDAARLAFDMVGRPLEQVYPRTRDGKLGSPGLELVGVSREGLFHEVSLSVRAGEIVGLAGLVGAGRSELARAIYGLYPVDAGTMRIAGKVWRPRQSRDALRSGLVYIPEERKRQGFVLDHALESAIGIGFSDQLTHWGIVRGGRERERVRGAIERYGIRATGPRQPVATLSGGNQQKALLARWLERDPRVVILDEPTRGVDVGAKAQIHALIDQLAAQGKAILFISSDLGEIVGMSDRILVMNRGTIETELQGPEMTAQNVILAASGLYTREVGSHRGV
ncbi:MAG TPA: sugar ABC transporter ATP-binding protein [Planctomycetaceae bacterium]|jgi:rhamnose transport system ATP-binding protein|nr:sugar ABC transporter ATP-binding protein [Planctomycetaceae bacterium]